MSNDTAKHTPGPWEWVDSPAWGYSSLWNPETRQEVLSPGGRNDADSPEVWMGEEMSTADRNLIRAAPDLLAVLKEAVAKPVITEGEEWWERVFAAVAKAESHQ